MRCHPVPVCRCRFGCTENAQFFGRYVGHLGQVAQSYEILNILRLGRRFSIRFRPAMKDLWGIRKDPRSRNDQADTAP